MPEERNRKGNAGSRGDVAGRSLPPQGTYGGSCSPYRPSSCHILAPWLVADEEESTEQTLSPSRMSHSCSSPRLQLAGPLVRIVLPY